MTARPQPPAPLEPRLQSDAQEWPFLPGPRKINLFVQPPDAGLTADTGLMLVLHNWGGLYDEPHYLQWCRTFADRYNVVALSVNYLQSGPAWREQIHPYDHGYLQAVDAIRALHAIRRRLLDRRAAFNQRRIFGMGVSGGGNVIQMALKFAPHTFACGVDICGMPGLTDGIAYGLREFGSDLDAKYSRDPQSPNYLPPDLQEIRDFGRLDHCRLLRLANPDLKIVIIHGIDDHKCPVVHKIGQFQRMVHAGLDVDGRFLTPLDVDGRAVANTGHSLGDREQILIKYADHYLKPAGPFARSRSSPTDFERAKPVEYPTSNGRVIIDYAAAPTVRFQPNHP